MKFLKLFKTKTSVKVLAGFVVTSGVLVLGFQNCSKTSFTPVEQASTAIIQPPVIIVSAPTCVNPLSGAILQEGQSYVAWNYSSIPASSSEICRSEARMCVNGQLTGSFQNPNCVKIPSPNDCSFKGALVRHGQSITTWQAQTVAFGGSCVSQSRTCNNGVLSGSYQFNSCIVTAAANCNINNTYRNGVLEPIVIPHAQSRTPIYDQASVPFGGSCTPRTLSCFNGVVTGTARHLACTVQGAPPPRSCTFNGRTIAHNGSVTVYQSLNQPFGGACTPYTRTCVDGTMSSPNYTHESCTVAAALNCNVNDTFRNGVNEPITIAHLGTRTPVYMTATVPNGQQCVPQSLGCNNGAVTGAARQLSCTVENAPPPLSCTFNGRTIPHNGTVVVYASANLPYGGICTPHTRTCVNGVMSAPLNYTSETCSVAPGAACNVNDTFRDGVNEPITIAHLGTRTPVYTTASVPFGQQCVQQSLSCDNGVVSGAARQLNCTVQGAPPPRSCTFNGRTIAHNGNVTVFESLTQPYGGVCTPHTRTCIDGTMSSPPNYTNESCVVAQGAACTVLNTFRDGVNEPITIAHLGTRTPVYATASVPHGQQCVVETLGCNNGIVTGAARQLNCTVQNAPPPLNCTFNGRTIPHNGTVEVFPSDTVPYGQQCVSQTRTCVNGVMSSPPPYTIEECNPLPPPEPTPTPVPTPVPTPPPLVPASCPTINPMSSQTWQQQITSMPPRLITPAEIPLYPHYSAAGYTVSGKVSRYDGQPLANAAVVVSQISDYGSKLYWGAFCSMTDSSGNYSIPGLPNWFTAVTINVIHPEYSEDYYNTVGDNTAGFFWGTRYSAADAVRELSYQGSTGVNIRPKIRVNGQIINPQQ